MVERPGILGWVLFRFFYSLRLFRDKDVQTLRGLAADGRLVYVLSHKHVYNALYFNYAFRRFGLPLARTVTVIFTLVFAPLMAILRYLFGGRERRPMRKRAAAILDRGEAAMLFLRRGPQPGPPGQVHDADELLRGCLDAQRAGGRPVILVPMHLFWGGSPVRLGSPSLTTLRRILGGPEDPGAFRSFVQLFRYFRHQWPRLGEPLRLDEFLVAHPDLDDDALLRRLRFELTHRTELVRRVIQGPRRKGARRICDEVLRGPRLQEIIAQMASQKQEPPVKFERMARGYLKEIAAEPGHLLLNFFRWFLRKFVWYRIYDGLEVDEEGMAQLREASAKGPLMFMPTHRSHVDYLLLSWLVSYYDIAPPYIAAGDNLRRIPVVGWIFRRSGAFFIKRSFWNNRLYTVCLSEYLRKILTEGYNIEFFIEGTRSRSGKVLTPRLGLLKWIADAALDGRVRNVQIAPLSVGYEKVIEEGAITREASGGQKKPEDLGQVLKAGRVLTSRFGRLNFQVHKPYDLREALAELGATKDSDEQTRNAAINQLAFRVVREISLLSLVTPTALVSTALLVTGRRTVDRRIVDPICQWLLERLRFNGARVSRALVAPQTEEGAEVAQAELLQVRSGGLEKALQLLARDSQIQIGGPRGAPAYQVPEERRLSLAYYRNGLINFLTAESIVARAVLTAGDRASEPVAREEVMRRARLLSRLFKHEFVYVVKQSFDEIFDETVARLDGWGLRSDDRGLSVEPTGRLELELLALLQQDFVEAYWAAARTLEELLKGPVGRKALMGHMGDLADRLFYRGEIQRREACSKTLFFNALSALLDMGVLTESVGRSRQGPPVALAEGYDSPETLAAFVRSIEELRGPDQPDPSLDLTAPMGLERRSALQPVPRP
jgi:glycerol-3-phosphate O-acyltransferase